MLDQKQFMFAFKTTEAATKCKEFVDKYKLLHGYYPRVAPGKDIRIVPELGITVVRLEDLTQLQQKCQIAQLGLIGIDSFNYTLSRKFTDVNFVGENFQNDMQLDIDYAKVLDIIYKM